MASIQVPLEDRLRWAAQERANGIHKAFRRTWAGTAVACAVATVVFAPAVPVIAVGVGLASVGFFGAAATWIGGILPTRRARQERAKAIDAALAKGDADRALQLYAAGTGLDRFPEASRAQLYRDIELSQSPVEVTRVSDPAARAQQVDGVELPADALERGMVAVAERVSDATLPVSTALGEANGAVRLQDPVAAVQQALTNLDRPVATLATIVEVGTLAKGSAEAAKYVALHADELATRIEAVELGAGVGTDHFLVAGSSKAFAAVAYHACLKAEQHYPGFGFGEQAAHWATRAPGVEHTFDAR